MGKIVEFSIHVLAYFWQLLRSEYENLTRTKILDLSTVKT